MKEKVKCMICGKTIKQGAGRDGLPNGVGFVNEAGQRVDVCVDCLMDTERVAQWVTETEAKKAKENA